MFNPGVEGLGDRILGEPEEVATTNPGEVTGASDEHAPATDEGEEGGSSRTRP